MGKYLMSDTDLSSLVIRAQTGDRSDDQQPAALGPQTPTKGDVEDG